MSTENNDDQKLTTGQFPGPGSDDLTEPSDAEETTSENISEIAMRINLLGKLVIPPPAP